MTPSRGAPLPKLAAVLCAGVLACGCGPSGTTPSGGNSRGESAVVHGDAATVARSVSPEDRRRWLEMFARGYFPGRSGQIFLVPREGDILTTRDALHPFMHGSPWDYDTRIPFLLHGAPFVRPGEYGDAVDQRDMAPTLAALLGLPPASTMTGRVLEQAIRRDAGRPAVVALFVLDGMRADYFERYGAVMPTLERLRREGAWFPDARVTFLPTVTTAGHATIGTGTDPSAHGMCCNTIFDRGTGRSRDLDTQELMAPTIGDLWNRATDGRAVIIGQGGALRATVGLVGHGACIVEGRPVIAYGYRSRDGGWETDPGCYRLPDYVDRIRGERYWKEAGGTWMGHDIAESRRFRASSLYQRFEGEALLAAIEHEPIGQDDVADLLLVNLKGPDYVGHAYGPDAPEIRETLAELDRQLARVLEALAKKAGSIPILTAITADHGMPGEPAPGRRHYGEEVVQLIHARFDPQARLVQQYANDTADSQIYLDEARLKELGHSVQEMAELLERQGFVAAAFTDAEVRAAAAR